MRENRRSTPLKYCMTVIATPYAYNMVEQGLCSEVVIALGYQYDDVKPKEDTWEPRYPDCTSECYTVLKLLSKSATLEVLG